MTTVYHPTAFFTYQVPEDKVEEWVEAGWLLALPSQEMTSSDEETPPSVGSSHVRTTSK